MAAYLARRLLAAGGVLLGSLTLLFLLLHSSVGDPAAIFLHPDLPADLARRRVEALGLDRPLGVQYLLWLKGALSLDLGLSFHGHDPVARRILAALPYSLLLGGASLAVTFLAGLAVALLSARRPGGSLDRFLTTATLAAYSLPVFWVAVMLAAAAMHLVPALPVAGVQSRDLLVARAGPSPPGALEVALDTAKHMVLPVLALALAQTAGVARFARGSLLDALGHDSIRAARARGLPEGRVLRHALRNALLPVITLLGLYMPGVVSGSVVVEWVFAWPGTGSLLVEAVQRRDFPLVMGLGVVAALAVAGGSLLADLLYGLADPRVRRG